LDEDGLFKLIESLPAKKSKYELLAEKEASKVALDSALPTGSACSVTTSSSC